MMSDLFGLILIKNLFVHCTNHVTSALSPSLLRSGHYDPDAVRSCAQTVALHWQTLMLRIEDRLKLVNASAAFYRTSQQVTLTVCLSPPVLLYYFESVYLPTCLSASPGVWGPGES